MLRLIKDHLDFVAVLVLALALGHHATLPPVRVMNVSFNDAGVAEPMFRCIR